MLDEVFMVFMGVCGVIECVGSLRMDVGVYALRNSAYFDFARMMKDGMMVELYDGVSV